MRVLVADGDSSRQKALADACAARGYVVDRAGHGPGALEQALERPPGVVVCPVDLPVIDGARLAEILRANPRTRAVSMLYLVEDELDAPLSLDLRDRVVASPWAEQDVLEQLEAIAERKGRDAEPARDVELEGKLAQIALVDLIQMLHLSRKTGTLRVTPDGAAEAAEIHLLDGQILDAVETLRDGSTIGGEKALFRMLAWRQGHFSFAPGRPDARPRITQPTRALLLEGARQLDESAQLRGHLPGPDVPLRFRVPRRELETRAQPLTREVLAAIETWRRVGEIVDRCPVPDAQVVRVLHELLRRGALEVDLPGAAAEAPGAESEGAFTPQQRRRARDWAAAQVPPAGPVLKALVVPASPALVAPFTEALCACSDFVADRGRTSGPPWSAVAALGHFVLGDELRLRLLAVSPDPRLAPTWEVAAYGSLGTIILLDTPLAPSLAQVERISGALRATSARPLRHAVQVASGAPTLGDAERSELERGGGGPLFVLPRDPDPERIAVVRNLLAGLVP